MFYQHSNGSVTLPSGFRYHEDLPQTPEPTMSGELTQPSPPRPTRLKIKRRNLPSRGSLGQFLASVATAADVPLPTIELPNPSADLEMLDREEMASTTSGLLAPQVHSRFVSPPKTPVPALPKDEAASQRPDWSLGASSPDDYFTRPTSSLSNASDFSDDSFYSGSMSRPSDDGSCTSPDSDVEDPFGFPSISKGKGKAPALEQPVSFTPLNAKFRSKTRKDAAWTKAMSAHLWSTYLVYLQDPTVTPFRIGASAVPPEGVCHRVAREARRSWKGPPKTGLRRSTRLSHMPSRATEKSGSSTPTESPKVYAQWPHSSKVTRDHLRYLCKKQDTLPVQRHLHLQSRSPTPFTKPSFDRSRLRTPEPLFSTQDIALSLTTSVAESMQPGGPLAQLALDDSATTSEPSSSLPWDNMKTIGFAKARGMTLGTKNQRRRLGTPFARTYGPSSSHIFEISRPSPPRTQSDIAGPLRSPVKFDQSRSLNGTQKRRAQHSLEDEISPSGAVLRPSVLDEQLFGGPLNNQSQRRVRRTRGFSLGDEAFGGQTTGLFRAPSPMDITASQPITSPKLQATPNFNAPPRLRSPFQESGPSQTFPRRLFQDGTATIKRNHFATMNSHQTRHSIESFDFGEGPSLQTKLDTLELKLKEIQEREASAKH